MSYSDFDSGPDYLAPMAQDDEIGARVREVRGSATQEAFGKRLGVSRGAVANWERGLGIKRENMQAIVDKFRVSFEWLPPDPLARFARNFIGLQET